MTGLRTTGRRWRSFGAAGAASALVAAFSPAVRAQAPGTPPAAAPARPTPAQAQAPVAPGGGADGGTPVSSAGTAADAPRPVTRSVNFDAAIAQALARNPNAQTALQEVRRVQGLMEEARAASIPTLTANGTYTHLDNPRTATIQGATFVTSPQNQWRGDLTLLVPILAPSSWANWSRAADQLQSQRLSARDVQRQVAVNVARAYLTVFAQKRQVEVNQRARDNAKAHLDYADARLRGGIGNRVDWARAGEELEADEANLQTSYANLYRAQESLGILLGEEEPVDAQAVPELYDLPNLDQGLAEISTRTDLMLYREQQSNADRSLNLTWTEYLPNVNLVFQPFLLKGVTFGAVTSGWTAQAVLAWSLFDGGARYGRTHEREAVFEQAKIQLAAATRQANSDVRTSVDGVERTSTAVQRARNSARLANEAMRLAELSYRAGASTNLELIDAQRRARDAESQAIVAEDNARQAAVDLLSATGRFPAQLRQTASK